MSRARRHAGWDEATWRDLGVVVLVGGVQLVAISWVRHYQPDRRDIDALAVTILAAAAAALFVRRQYPVAALSATVLATLLYHLLNYPRGPIFIAPVVAVFSAMMAGRRLAAWLTLAFGFAAFLWLPVVVAIDSPPAPTGVFGLAGWMLVAGVAAEVARVQSERVAATRRSQEEAARRRNSEERMRIARELHDVLAHSIAVINVQAAVGLHLQDERPDQARTALAAIKEVSKDALDELRSVVAHLRADDEEAQRAPGVKPSLANLETLIARATSGGLQIRTDLGGDLEHLPPAPDLAAYRIVQEALTNVIRHAGSTTATVRVTRADGELMVEVEDDGAAVPEAASDPDEGKGITGMRERAAALGGVVEAGPRPNGGFRVMARLPLDGAT